MMGSGSQLRLVGTHQRISAGVSADPVLQVFEHWVFMFGKSLQRTKLGPTRRRAIAAALAMGFDVEQLNQATDGVAADPMERLSEEGRDRLRDLSWFLADEERIERYAERGARLADRLQLAQASQARAAVAEGCASAEAVVAARERLREFAAQCRGAVHG